MGPPCTANECANEEQLKQALKIYIVTILNELDISSNFKITRFPGYLSRGGIVPKTGCLMAKQELFHRNFVFIGVKGGPCLVAGLLFVCKAEPRLR